VALAIIVPGHGALGPDGVYRISARCRRVLAEAERLALELAPRAVVFSGWSPRGFSSEAEQMRELWAGPDVELVVESTARTTAENAARTLPVLAERGITRAVVVCAPVHLRRTRYFFRHLYGPFGIETSFRVPRVAPSPAGIAWELLALPVRRVQLRAAAAEVSRAHPPR
jgi:uncharacterized SAM-binding protein YcdF (DUF218 family)